MRFSEVTQLINGNINPGIPREFHYTTVLPFGASCCFCSCTIIQVQPFLWTITAINIDRIQYSSSKALIAK